MSLSSSPSPSSLSLSASTSLPLLPVQSLATPHHIASSCSAVPSLLHGHQVTQRQQECVGRRCRGQVPTSHHLLRTLDWSHKAGECVVVLCAPMLSPLLSLHAFPHIAFPRRTKSPPSPPSGTPVVFHVSLFYTRTTRKLWPLVAQPEGKNLIQAFRNVALGEYGLSCPFSNADELHLHARASAA